MGSARILLTTSDYLPKLGGLTSYTLNIEKCLLQLGLEYELFNWKEQKKTRRELSSYTHILNVHYLGGFFLRPDFKKQKIVNFIHGSEILFYSPVLIKKIIKQLIKKKQIRYFEESFMNIFISNFTRDKLESKGLSLNYSRDLVFQNCINVENAFLQKLELRDSNEINLCCIARDVPHKNIDGVTKFAELLAKISKRKINLYITSDRTSTNSEVMVFNLSNLTNEQRDQVYKDCHFNLLLSKDHSAEGFYEGFGLSILEGNIYGCPGVVLSSGGLPENVHHKFNGFVLNSIEEEQLELFWDYCRENYQALRLNSYEHVLQNHSIGLYRQLIQRMLVV